MFTRTRSARHADRAATATFDDVLSQLEAPVEQSPPGAVDSAGGGSQDGGHAAALRATRDAQHQAQEMLSVAARTRSEATEQAEQILAEAREAAARMREEAARDAELSRREAADWVAAQRARIDTVVAELTDAAEHDAERIRTEAMQTAMAEAESTARRYVDEAVARGARDADALRARAHEVLGRAAGLGRGTSTTVRDLATTLETTIAGLHDQLADVDALLAETEPQQPPAPPAITTAQHAAPRPTVPTADDPLGLGPAPGRRQLGALFHDTQIARG